MATKTTKKKAKKPSKSALAAAGHSIVPTITTPKSKSGKKPGRGRPSFYDPELHPKQAFMLTGRMGADIPQIAEMFGVSKDTIWQWMKKHSEFSDAIKAGRELFDTVEVEGSLLRSALGYQTEERTFERKVCGKNDDGTYIYAEVMTKRVVRQIAPSITAQIFWLQNRMPDRWKNVRFVEGTVDHRHAHLIAAYTGQKEGLVVDLSKLSRADAESLRGIIKKSTTG